MTSSKKKFTLFLILSLLVLAFIFYNSTTTGEESNAASRGLMDFVLNIIDPHGKLDTTVFHYLVRKGAHFAEYFVYGFCLFGMPLAIREETKKLYVSLTLLIAMSSAVIDEIIQSFTSRTSSPRDVLLDFIGASCGVLFMWLVHRGREKRKARKTEANK